MSFCANCDQANVEILSGVQLQWRCPVCSLTAAATPEQTLLAFEDTTDANSGDPTLYATMLEHAGGDPAAIKVRRECPNCKTSQLMSRYFLGDSESAHDICPKCNKHTPAVAS